MLKMLSLFSGIGGFDIAARWTGQIETVAFVEIDPFCQKVLKKHWPTVPIISDIREATGERIREIVADTEGGENDQRNRRCMDEETKGGECSNASVGVGNQPVRDSECGQLARLQNREIQERENTDALGGVGIDILTGGFPCQPFSCAGKRKGTEDDRWLWPEMLRVIKEVRPKWVIGENVAGLISIDNGMVFEDCCTSLEAEGYAVQSFILPACAVNAPHRRDRVWIVARKNADDAEGRGCGFLHTENIGKATGEIDTFADTDSPFNNAQCSGCAGSTGRTEAEQNSHGTKNRLFEQADSHAPDTDLPGSQGRDEYGQRAGERTPGQGYTEQWEEDWYSVALRTCVRNLDDGLPGRMAGRHRVNKLKALGNSVVPQVVYPILQAIVEIEGGN